MQEGAKASPLLTAAAKLAETEVRRILRRVTAPANKVRGWVMGRRCLAAAANPTVLTKCSAAASAAPSTPHTHAHAAIPAFHLLQKEAKATMKPLGRMLAKIMHASPMPVAEQLIRQVGGWVQGCQERSGPVSRGRRCTFSPPCLPPHASRPPSQPFCTLSTHLPTHCR